MLNRRSWLCGALTAVTTVLLPWRKPRAATTPDRKLKIIRGWQQDKFPDIREALAGPPHLSRRVEGCTEPCCCNNMPGTIRLEAGDGLEMTMDNGVLRITQG